MRCKDYDHFNTHPSGHEALRRKPPNVFIYEEVTDECGLYLVRCGGGYDPQNLPPFRIYFSTADGGDYVMVKHDTGKGAKLSPHSSVPPIADVTQEEMAL